MTKPTTIPEPIKLTEQELSELHKLGSDGQALGKFVQACIAQGQRKTRENEERGRAIYTALSAKYGIDVNHVQWAPNFDTGMLMPIGISLAQVSSP